MSIGTFSIDDLPPELTRQLSKRTLQKEGDTLRSRILAVLQCDKALTVDEILIEIYMRFKVIESKKIIGTRLSQMYEEGEILRIKRGVYRIKTEGEL